MSLHLTAIVPRLPAMLDGIGDYAFALARRSLAEFDVQTRFVVTDPLWKGDAIDRFPVSRLHEHCPRELISALPHESTAAVLLHYEAYAYARRGCPEWLVAALESWCAASDERALLVVFHELYASGPPWRSSFWLSRKQRNLVGRLARLSNQNMTSLELYCRRLNRMDAKARSLPIFSNVGEPSNGLRDLSYRRRRLVVFGTVGRRKAVYRRSAKALNRLCHEFDLNEIWDIGREGDLESERMDFPVVRCGELSGSEISQILLDSVAGVVDYPIDMLAKSSIFAAYCAHRLFPIVAAHGSAMDADGLAVGAQYFLLGNPETPSAPRIQTIADQAFDWYHRHSIEVHAQRLWECIENAGLADCERLIPA